MNGRTAKQLRRLAKLQTEIKDDMVPETMYLQDASGTIYISNKSERRVYKYLKGLHKAMLKSGGY